jgi:hypothetical protein
VLKALTTKEDEMKVETLYLPNLRLRGHSLTVWHRGILMLLSDLPPGARLESVNITIDDKDPNKGYANVDTSTSLSVAEK